MKDAGNFYLSEAFYFSRFFFFSVYLETVGEILFLNFSRRNVNFLLLHARKIEKKFSFETKESLGWEEVASPRLDTIAILFRPKESIFTPG